MNDLDGRKRLVDYDLNKILADHGRTIRSKIVSERRIELTDKIVQELPYFPEDAIRKGKNNIVEIIDDRFNAEHDDGRLILRIGPKSKTWYVVTANRKGFKQKMIKVGAYAYNKNGYYKDDEANVKTARDRFPEIIKAHFKRAAVIRQSGDMTIRQYLESGQYENDRKRHPIENGKMKPVRPAVIKSILSQFEPWLDFKLREVNQDWPEQFKEYWDNRYIEYNKEGRKNNPDHEDKFCTPDTQRHYFTEIQAMFSIAEKAGYIERNWLKGGSRFFPKKKKRRGTTTVYDFSYEDLFDFVYNDAEKGTANGKLIVCMMAVTGCRNSEVYKNYRSNLELLKDKNKREYFNLHIPLELSKTGDSGVGDVQIRHPFVVNKLKEHLQREDVKNSRYIFPSPVKNKHCSDDAYRKLWTEVKTMFGLSKKARQYSLRATLGTRISKKMGPQVSASLLRDSPETAMLYYDDVDTDRMAHGLDAVFNDSDVVKSEKHDVAEDSDVVIKLINLDDAEIPEAVQKSWNMFKAKRTTEDNKMLVSDYDKFVYLIGKQVSEGKIDDADVEMWLMFQ